MRKNFSQKNLPFYGKMRDNRINHKAIFSHTHKRRFYNEARIKITRKEARNGFVRQGKTGMR